MTRPSASSALAAMRCHCILLFALAGIAAAFDKYPKQFVFEVADNEDFCFYEQFDQSNAKDKFLINYRVIKGGHNDIDFAITSPSKESVYAKRKQHADEYTLSVQPGTYSFCFGNQFSTVTHKQVFFSLTRERPETLAEESGITDRPQAMTLLQDKMENIHEHLARVEDMQSIYRAHEAEGRSLSEDLCERVMLLSLMLAGAILTCGFGQVVILRTFFSDKKSREYPRYPSARA